MSKSYKVTPIFSLDAREFNSFDDYEEQYNTNCSFVEYTILSKHIPICDRMYAVSNKDYLYEGYLGNILGLFCSNLTLDFIVFDDGYCGFIKPNGEWIKLIVDKNNLKCYNHNET